jgi:two-component system response regulator AtoC
MRGHGEAERGGLETEPLPSGSGPPASLSARQWALVVYHREGTLTAVLAEGQPVVVGRDPSVDVVVDEKSLSREHARFTLEGEQVLVEDLDSRNGTFVGGQRVPRAEVRPGDEIVLGNVVTSVVILPARPLDLEGHEAFQRMLEQEVRRAGHFGRGAALLMIRGPEHVSRWQARVRKQLRDIDRVGFYGPNILEIVLPEAGPTLAVDLARTIVGLGDDPPLFAGVAVFPGAASTAEHLLGVCLDACQHASDEARVQSAEAGAWLAEGKHDPLEAIDGPVVAGEVMRDVLRQVGRFAGSTVPVLILGETGTGKEVIARAIHDRGPRRGRPMGYLNCAAIPATLVESVFFGHEKGAFTGAIAAQKGVFEAADGSTLLLDEIGELSPAAQASLLRVLEVKKVMRLGATREIPVDVRVIAATHRDLEAMCETGAFRQDLLFRINVVPVEVPPLRQRLDEIEPLARRFLAHANRANERRVHGVRADAAALLKLFPWPGNIRELRNVIERAVIIAQGEEIVVDDLPARVRAAARAPAAPAAVAREPPPRVNVREQVLELEADLIQTTLEACGGNQTEAARRLEVPLRTLVRKIKILRDRGRKL